VGRAAVWACTGVNDAVSLWPVPSACAAGSLAVGPDRREAAEGRLVAAGYQCQRVVRLRRGHRDERVQDGGQEVECATASQRGEERGGGGAVAEVAQAVGCLQAVDVVAAFEQRKEGRQRTRVTAACQRPRGEGVVERGQRGGGGGSRHPFEAVDSGEPKVRVAGRGEEGASCVGRGVVAEAAGECGRRVLAKVLKKDRAGRRGVDPAQPLRDLAKGKGSPARVDGDRVLVRA
jgi:hypothetical protein